MKYRVLSSTIAAAFVVFSSACGTSGSKPTFFAEVVFQITPAQGGTAPFRVVSLTAGGVEHQLSGTFTAPLNIILENAAPPYEGMFGRADGSSQEISARLIRLPVTGFTETDVTDTTSGSRQIADVSATEPGTVVGAPPAVTNPEIRFNVCAPFESGSSCFPNEGTAVVDEGTNGLPFTGSIGDAFVTRLVEISGSFTPQTPSIYFLEDAHDSINGVFRGTGYRLHVELIINGETRQVSVGTADVVVRQDL